MFTKYIKVELRRVDELPDSSMNAAEDACMARGKKRKVSADDEALFRPAKARKVFHHMVNDEEQASKYSKVELRRVDELPDSSVNAAEDACMARGKKCSAKELAAAKRCEFKAKYEQLHKLGKGGFGTVFAGYRKEDNLPVAIKHISKRKVLCKAKAESGKKIAAEVATMLKLSAGTPGSSAAVSLLDWFDLRKELVLVMERPVPAVDLEKYIEANAGTITEETAKVILKQLIEAAKELEDKNIFHRDIKTDNVLIETGSDVPRVRLIDFGVSCFCNKSSRYRVFCGTPDFCPPEWRIHRSYRPGPTTVWQLGVVLYETLHTETTFNTRSFLNEKLNISEELSENCQDFLKTCFNLDPKRRPKLNDLLRHRWFR